MQIKSFRTMVHKNGLKNTSSILNRLMCFLGGKSVRRNLGPPECIEYTPCVLGKARCGAQISTVKGSKMPVFLLSKGWKNVTQTCLGLGYFHFIINLLWSFDLFLN